MIIITKKKERNGKSNKWEIIRIDTKEKRKRAEPFIVSLL